MGKTATTVEEQMQILKNRGMILDFEPEKIKEILLDIGYYRLGFYWNSFEKNKNHEFEDGTKFSDVTKLYYIDVELRNLLLKYLNRIEINFKTSVIYYVSNQYKESPTWFFNPKIVHIDLESPISAYYDKSFIKKNKAIKKHHDKYLNDRYAPAWKTLEFFTLGTVIRIFESLKDETLKLKISKIYGVNYVKKFQNHLTSMLYLRNTCAHGGVLFDFNLPTGIDSIPDFNLFQSERTNLHGIIKVITYYLSKISENRKIEFEKKINDIISNDVFSKVSSK